VGLIATWFIWVEVLPALGILDTWNLGSTMVDQTVAYMEDGVQKFRTESIREYITVADALIAIVIGLLTFTAARNIPGLMEIMLLVRLPLDASTRYAARMIARYFIIVVGLATSFSIVGIGWAKVQWLAAGLTVGLGFGLQEIFANFVSGLIILFERPVRIADVVTIGDVSGVVSRIQIRATTITDWDRKEYIVPNKEFVTGRLLNWTLSDQTNRIVIDVGVAYGSDTSHARSLLLEAAEQHPDVMSDPGPVATFEGFGDSTLNLRLRCYLPNLDNRLMSITQIHESIDQKFKDAGLEISFPQRDLHIRSVSNDAAVLPPAASNSEPTEPTDQSGKPANGLRSRND
jgi:potassium efflux system protein